MRHQIADTGRYYDAARTIVLRKGLLLEEERRYLWHELMHADRRDTSGHNSPAVERVVERHAAAAAMPWVSLREACRIAEDHHHLVDLLKVPAEWVAFRIGGLHPAQKRILGVPITVDTSTLRVLWGASELS